MPESIVSDSAGRTVLVFHGSAVLQEFRESKTGSKNRSSRWTLDGVSVFAFLDVEKNPLVAAAIEGTGVGGSADVVLVRARRLRRKDGSPIPQVGPWADLNVFDDTVTTVASVNGVEVVDGPRVDVSALPVSPTAIPDVTVSPVSVARDRDVSMERFSAAVAVGVPRQVLNQMAALMILDGCDPLAVRKVLLGRALPQPSERVKPARPVPVEPVGVTDPPAPASPSVSAAVPVSGPLMASRPRRDNTPPPPRRAVQALIGPEQVSVLQKVAVRAGVVLV